MSSEWVANVEWSLLFDLHDCTQTHKHKTGQSVLLFNFTRQVRCSSTSKVYVHTHFHYTHIDEHRHCKRERER